MLAGGGTKFFRDLSVLVGGQIAVKLLGFVAFAYLARRLDPKPMAPSSSSSALPALSGSWPTLGLA